VKEQGKALCHPAIGVEAFCMRCYTKGHEVKQCKEKMYCGCENSKTEICGKPGSQITCPNAMAWGMVGCRFPGRLRSIGRRGSMEVARRRCSMGTGAYVVMMCRFGCLSNSL
jgi:hypothetical protein